ncbi:MAG: FecR domain-containing protein [Rhodospirillales bacterium]|nr:FecR domain-containing protein [Rhodospirillales bacterium]
MTSINSTTRTGTKRAAALALGLALAASVDARAQGPADIGTAAAVVNKVTGSVSSRDLRTGDRVHANEEIATAALSKGQIVFRDETSLTVGPDSRVTLDRFVYDPARGGSTASINAARGVFRFVSGNMPSQSYQVRTPAGTIGVRGTIFDLIVEADGTVVVQLIEGGLDIQARGRTVRMDRNGDVVVLGPDGSIRETIDLTERQRRLLAPIRNILLRRDGTPDFTDDRRRIQDIRRNVRTLGGGGPPGHPGSGDGGQGSGGGDGGG